MAIIVPIAMRTYVAAVVSVLTMSGFVRIAVRCVLIAVMSVAIVTTVKIVRKSVLSVVRSVATALSSVAAVVPARRMD